MIMSISTQAENLDTNMTKAVQPILHLGIKSLLAILLIGCCWCPSAQAFDEDAVARLKAVEKKIGQVVSENMKCCVAVFDGEGSGSGVIISAEGLVLTAGHVMALPNKDKYEITLQVRTYVRK